MSGGDVLRLAVIGTTGSGKSTLAGMVEQLCDDKGLTHTRIKLAQPLYDLQAEVYRFAGAKLAEGAQDQMLMEDLADALRRINPRTLVDQFAKRLAMTRARVVINDDLRDPDVDAPALRAAGFRIVRVKASEAVRAGRLRARSDLTRSERSTTRIDRIEPDAVLTNDSGLKEYSAMVGELIGEWL